MIYLVSNVASVHEFYQQVSSFSVLPVVSSAKKTLTYRRYKRQLFVLGGSMV